MGTFTDWLSEQSPPRLTSGDWEQRWLFAFGAIGDGILDAATYAVQARFIGYAPVDALSLLGRDRMLVRGPNETELHWRERLFGAWGAWAWAGTIHPDGLLAQLTALGFSGVELLEPVELTAPDRALYWSQFWIVVPFGGHAYSGSIPGDDETGIRQVVRQFRPAHVICQEVYFMDDEEARLWDWPQDGLTWDDLETAGITWDQLGSVLSVGSC